MGWEQGWVGLATRFLRTPQVDTLAEVLSPQYLPKNQTEKQVLYDLYDNSIPGSRRPATCRQWTTQDWICSCLGGSDASAAGRCAMPIVAGRKAGSGTAIGAGAGGGSVAGGL